ncbi:putative E3 ubiquitin-protein ligase XBAT35 [Hibiscus syriacus]|uniref:E3 ubiquitin-protein ligase XBAT35 n=1 Tax=Hibiscus syriacus TaxID=106335 RepID=A0A6A2XLV2_HIBSY|nr:putative E3 ubiquitin-protein ligase XBAT35 [Hibiscus syriacus]
MGQQQSKDELLYNQVNYGNVEGIKSLFNEGAGLEWIDKEGKTPLILACLNPSLFDVAQILIELGANINAYRPGRHGGTPLHHAAKRGLLNTVKLLLSHGANPLAMNDDCQTPLDVARAKGNINVVRAIEEHICLFSGWMREFYGPGFIEIFVPQLVSRKVWVVVLPTGPRNHTTPLKLGLAIYSILQDAQPRTVIPLWKANLEEPKPNQPDPSATIVDNSSSSFRSCHNLIDINLHELPQDREGKGEVLAPPERLGFLNNKCMFSTMQLTSTRSGSFPETRIKLAPGKENDMLQLQWFCDACKGIPQVRIPAFLHNSHPPAAPATAPPDAEDLELAMAINASIQSTIAETTAVDLHSGNQASASAGWDSTASSSNHSGSVAPTAFPPSKASISKWDLIEGGCGSNSTEGTEIHNNEISAVNTTMQPSDSIPSAPPAPAMDEIVEDGSIQYPSIDSTPIYLSSSNSENLHPSAGQTKQDEAPSCPICLDAPSEAACVPCGHVAGCMPCLNEIKAKKWGCPVCRAEIQQVIKLYRV